MAYRFLGLVLFLFIHVVLVDASTLPALKPKDTRLKLEEILKTHAVHHQLSPELIGRTLSNFIDELDPSKTYLLEDEIITWTSPSPELLSKILEGVKQEKFTAFEEIHSVMLRAIERRSQLENKIKGITPPPALSASTEELKDLKWAKSAEELENRLLIIKALQIKTASKLSTEAETQTLFFQRIDKRRLNREEELQGSSPAKKEQIVLSLFLKAASSALDSQTNYFTPSEANQFMIQVQQRLFGIGAQLRDDLNGFTITRLLEGGPALLDSRLKVGDRIIAVNQDPVMGMDITEAVELIRGPQDTPVLLTILRKQADTEDEEKFDITLNRAEIVLKETRLDASTTPFGDGSIAILKLHSFYQDPKYSSAKDLADALLKFKQEERLHGVILDLRNNAGGLLSQAVAVSGLFMSKGVVVSVKDHTQAIQKLRNIESKTVWNGPLIILTNRASASASEIVAQTLQEYGKAIVVGDKETYGKGTFQTFTLEASNYGKVNPQGEYKVTRGRYYTVSGKSPQLTGVLADIVVPGIFSEMEFGERYSKFPLETDQIPPSFTDDLSDIPALHRHQVARLYNFGLQQQETTYQSHLSLLKKNAGERIASNKNYQLFLKGISKKDFSFEEIEAAGQTDVQLSEAVNLMKDLIFLQQMAPEQPPAEAA